MSGIMQEWTHKLGLRQQGVLVAVVRGCDTAPKEAPIKVMARLIRGVLLNPHCGDVKRSTTFIMPWDDSLWSSVSLAVSKDHDCLPHHYIMHLVHAVEIIGYTHPYPHMREHFKGFYLLMCRKLHVNPETEEEMNQRLNADELTFAAGQ